MELLGVVFLIYLLVFVGGIDSKPAKTLRYSKKNRKR